ncbi:cupin domain-containing protein [Fimbriiglobus ruber]|uniref:Mannose-6-phosphate isomerase n=1 Tax=Fimbriiglobus ruber TaxID=1908690 RepID=A0A225DC98_9BACT|nr:cupin domain-containing protein [Fimbriiglobus ruber]OWK39171.1 Mannose-6-phosphate isomerase [Fimbriiglobus ruber]
MTTPANLFRDLPAHLPDEVVQTLTAAGAVRVERIISLGHTSPPGFWYDQPQHEWVTLLTGAATLRFEDEDQPVDLRPGDFLTIPARRRHRVEWTTPDEPTIWLAVHFGD